MGSKLFLGVQMDEKLDNCLSNSPEHLLKALLHEQGFLEIAELEDKKWLGKSVGSETTLESLCLSEAHVKSLLRKLLPACAFCELKLFPLIDE